jgi:pyroglutamyl-peptidase
MKSVLVTGFGPYGNERTNPTGDVVRLLDGKVVKGHRVRGVRFNVSAREVSQKLPRIIDSLEPRLVLNLGLAPGRMDLNVERVAINIADFRIPDASGRRLVDTSIDPNGPAAYFATIPIKKVVRSLLSDGVPASISNTAGTFLCNYIMYTSLNHLAKNGLNAKAGFIHVPNLPSQAAEKYLSSNAQTPSMSLETMLKGIELAIKTSLF